MEADCMALQEPNWLFEDYREKMLELQRSDPDTVLLIQELEKEGQNHQLRSTEAPMVQGGWGDIVLQSPRDWFKLNKVSPNKNDKAALTKRINMG